MSQEDLELKLALCVKSLQNVLNWIRQKLDCGNEEIPFEVLELVDPIFLVKNESEETDADPDADPDAEPHFEEDTETAHENPDEFQQQLPPDFVKKKLLGPKSKRKLNVPTTYQCSHCPSRYCSITELSRHALIHCSVFLKRIDIDTEAEGRNIPKKRIRIRNRNRKSRSKKLKTENSDEPKPKRIRIRKSRSKKKIIEEDDQDSEVNAENSDEPKPRRNRIRYPFTHKSRSKKIVSEEADSDESSQLAKPKSVKVGTSRKCTLCNKEFQNFYFFKKHVDEEHKVELFKCDICSTEFKARGSLNKHKKFVHNPNPTTHICQHCGKPFKREVYLNIHVNRIHVRELKYKCQYCSKAFVARKDKDSHEDRHVGRNERQCPYCGVMKHSNNYRSHVEYVHKGKRFQCKYCDTIIHQLGHCRPHLLLKHLDKVDTVTTAEAFNTIYVKPAEIGSIPKEQVQRSGPRTKFETGYRKNGGPYRCTLCFANFHNPNALEVHRIKHERDPEYKHRPRTYVKRVEDMEIERDEEAEAVVGEKSTESQQVQEDEEETPTKERSRQPTRRTGGVQRTEETPVEPHVPFVVEQNANATEYRHGLVSRNDYSRIEALTEPQFQTIPEMDMRNFHPIDYSSYIIPHY